MHFGLDHSGSPLRGDRTQHTVCDGVEGQQKFLTSWDSQQSIRSSWGHRTQPPHCTKSKVKVKVKAGVREVSTCKTHVACGIYDSLIPHYLNN